MTSIPKPLLDSSHRDFMARFRSRGLALVSDDSSLTGRSALVAPAFKISPEIVNEILTLRGNFLCVSLSPERSRAFLLSPMSRPQMNPIGSKQETIEHALTFCESVEAREGVSTGISASDRARTISILGEEQPSPRKLVKPGHIFPVEVREGGVLVRQAIPECSLDVVRLAGWTDAAVFAELLDSHGNFVNLQRAQEIAQQHQIPHLTMGALTRMRLEQEHLVYKVAEAKLPTKLAGEVTSVVYKTQIHSGEHIALVKGEIDPEKPTLTRVQPEFTFSDVFGGHMPPTRAQLECSLKAIGERGQGVLVYLRRPLEGQLKAQIQSWKTKFEEKGATSMMREYGLGAQILRDIGVRKVELLTNTKKNLAGLTSFGIEIVSQIPIPGYQKNL